MERWIDAHNHLQDPRIGDVASVVEQMQQAGVRRCVVNATHEGDWAAVAALADRYPEWLVPAFGVHPWQAHTVSEGWLARLAALLQRYPQSSIGEIGLDQWIDSPDLITQRLVFEEQLQLAREIERPVTIHCLKAWGALFEVFEKCPPPGTFLMHSFNGSVEVAQRLIPMGACFSFSGYFLHERKAKVLEVFRQLPQERILLETDAPDMAPPESVIQHTLADGMNHPANLPEIGRAFAERLAISVDDLAKSTGANAERCFGM